MSDHFDKLPKRWKIGGYTYTVHVVPSDSAKLDGADGYTHYQEQGVYLDETMKPQRAAVVALHEAIHIINWVYGITDESSEEEVTTQISTGLMAFWRDNAKVMQWINRVRKQ